MQRREFLKTSATPALAALADTRAGGKDRPNILLLISDQHSPHVLGCYGDKIVRTPTLDALAAKGVVFEHTYCQSPLCVPSRMSFLSGMQPCENKVWSNGDALSPDISTFGHSLGAAGYETTLIGRMHFAGLDQWHGFETHSLGIAVYPNSPLVLPPNLVAGARCDSRAGIALAGPGRTAYRVYDEDVAKATVEFLRQKGKDHTRPFCLVAGFLLPHPPFICPKRDFDYYYDRVTLPGVPEGYLAKLHPAVKLWRKHRGLEELTDKEIRTARASYYGLVTHLDRQLGMVLEALKETGLERNTIIIYTSDHGEMAGENGMWWKFNFYEGSVGVPLIVSCPERFQAGRRMREVTSLIDVRPTLEELAAGQTTGIGSGRSLVPLLKGDKVEWPNEAFSEFSLSPHQEAPMRMVRSGKWKLVHHEGYRPQLFDLESDPQEFHDLGESPAHGEVRQRLAARVLADWSMEQIRKEMAQRAPHRAVIAKWYRQANPPTPQGWVAPPDANIFPSDL